MSSGCGATWDWISRVSLTSARVAKLAYALDLGSSVFGRGGSSPPSRTIAGAPYGASAH